MNWIWLFILLYSCRKNNDYGDERRNNSRRCEQCTKENDCSNHSVCSVNIGCGCGNDNVYERNCDCRLRDRDRNDDCECECNNNNNRRSEENDCECSRSGRNSEEFDCGCGNNRIDARLEPKTFKSFGNF